MPNPIPRKILVVGASGELGEAVARYFAGEQHDSNFPHLTLWGRNQTRLAEVARKCETLGAKATMRLVDLMNVSEAIAILEAEDSAEEYDLMVVASGRGDVRPQDAKVEPTDLVQQLAIVNYLAPAALVSKLADRMAARGKGSIIVVGSAASFHALPFAASYAGSKAGLAQFTDALSIGMKPFGVHIGLISPGFIDTEGGRKAEGPRPFLLTPDQVAQRIGKMVASGRSHQIFPWPFAVLLWIDRLLPRFLRERLLRALAP